LPDGKRLILGADLPKERLSKSLPNGT